MKPLLTTLILAFFILPLITLAQYQPEVGADGTISEGLVPCEGSFCSPCDLVVLANTGIKVLLAFSFLFFAILAVKAGVGLVVSQGNSGALTQAKESFTNAFIGLIIILVAFLIVDTLLRQILKGGTGDVNGYGPWAKVQCATQVVPVQKSDLFAGDPEFINFVEAGGEESGVIGGGSNCPATVESNVVTIPGTSFKARPEIAEKFIAMRTAAKNDGVTLTVRSGWRSEQTQVGLFSKLCPSGKCGDAKAARPCSLGGNGSNHNSGNAIDISVGCGNKVANCNTTTYRWLKNNGGRFGFYNNLPTDPPHWSPSGR